ncbi:MAG: hypothetical protein NZL89_04685, partial [Leptospiraceae bacterium]|nr:hypothetical protein [Leptospiraceae bacterium]
ATALAAVAAEAQCDILIVGKFRVDRENSRISMQALIYNAESKRFIGRVEEESDITNRVFRHIDNLASAIVSTIYQYALQANKGSSYSHLRLLVLVPAFDTTEERQRAESELLALKKELSLRTPGNYLTVFEFFTKYKVAQAEQEHALQLAQHRDRRRIKAWLERYGVTDAYLVFVSENKVNITAVSERRIAETSYPVGSDLTARRQALDKVSEKTALQKMQRTQDRHFAVHAGLSGSRGMLFSGTRIGILAGPTLHASLRLWPFFEPQFRIEGHFGFRREDFAGLAGASLLGGLGYTWNKSRFALTPYAVAGIFTAHVRTIYAQTTVLLPGVTAGAIATWYIRSHWGVSLAVSGYYISDPQAPALFYTAALSTVLRFQ